MVKQLIIKKINSENTTQRANWAVNFIKVNNSEVKICII